MTLSKPNVAAFQTRTPSGHKVKAGRAFETWNSISGSHSFSEQERAILKLVREGKSMEEAKALYREYKSKGT